MLYIMHSIFYDGSSLFILSFLVILALALFKWINNLEILGLLNLTMLTFKSSIQFYSLHTTDCGRAYEQRLQCAWLWRALL